MIYFRDLVLEFIFKIYCKNLFKLSHLYLVMESKSLPHSSSQVSTTTATNPTGMFSIESLLKSSKNPTISSSDITQTSPSSLDLQGKNDLFHNFLIFIILR